MIRLVASMTDQQLLARIDQLEQSQEKLRVNLSKTFDHYRRDTLGRQWDVNLNLYADAISEAVYRKLVRLH